MAILTIALSVLLVAIIVIPLLWAAIQDGRFQKKHENLHDRQ